MTAFLSRHDSCSMQGDSCSTQGVVSRGGGFDRVPYQAAQRRSTRHARVLPGRYHAGATGEGVKSNCSAKRSILTASPPRHLSNCAVTDSHRCP
jgi:hypothetical protein